MKTYQLYINGQYVDPVNGEWFDTIDPYRGEAWAKIPRGTAADADKAVKAANEAMWNGPWAKMTASARGKAMRKLGDLVAANAERLAEIEVRDNGKLMAEMLGQLRYHPEWWWYFGGLVDKLEGGLVPIDKAETFAYTTHEPVGVVAALTAWNSPLLFVAWKCAAALAAGCAVIVKPSEFTSASTLEFAALTKEAGIPDGIFNVVTGFGPEAGSALISHPGVAKITFTGSDTTGAKVYETAAKSLKRVSLELGGKSPNIFFKDVCAEDDDFFDKAIEGFVMFALNQGEVCTCPSRALIHESIYERFMERALQRVGAIVQGSPLDPATMIGAQASAEQLSKILSYIEIGRNEGAQLLIGGERNVLGGDLAGGYYVKPTVFRGHNKMRVFQEEIFGPVVSVTTFKTEDEALAIANDTLYGLGAGVWSRDANTCYRFGRNIQAGRVWTNCYHAYPAHAAFGGYKQSGVGRETHKVMLDHYQQTKNMLVSYSPKKLGFF